MRRTIAAALAALTFAGAIATTAEARDRRHYRDRDNNGAAVAAGVAGLAIGAALASGSRDRGYYNNGRYYDRGYYGRGYDNRRYYRDRRYYGPPRYSYYDNRRPYRQRCDTVRQWDPYYGGYVRVRRCW